MDANWLSWLRERGLIARIKTKRPNRAPSRATHSQRDLGRRGAGNRRAGNINHPLLLDKIIINHLLLLDRNNLLLDRTRSEVIQTIKLVFTARDVIAGRNIRRSQLRHRGSDICIRQRQRRRLRSMLHCRRSRSHSCSRLMHRIVSRHTDSRVPNVVRRS
jgi:hypothetical protein